MSKLQKIGLIILGILWIPLSGLINGFLNNIEHYLENILPTWISSPLGIVFMFFSLFTLIIVPLLIGFNIFSSREEVNEEDFIDVLFEKENDEESNKIENYTKKNLSRGIIIEMELNDMEETFKRDMIIAWGIAIILAFIAIKFYSFYEYIDGLKFDSEFKQNLMFWIPFMMEFLFYIIILAIIAFLLFPIFNIRKISKLEKELKNFKEEEELDELFNKYTKTKDRIYLGQIKGRVATYGWNEYESEGLLEDSLLAESDFEEEEYNILYKLLDKYTETGDRVYLGQIKSMVFLYNWEKHKSEAEKILEDALSAESDFERKSEE